MPTKQTQEVIEAHGMQPSRGPATTFQDTFGEVYDFIVREEQSVSKVNATRPLIEDTLEALKENGIEFAPGDETNNLLNMTQGVEPLEVDTQRFVAEGQFLESARKFDREVERLKQTSPDERLKTFSQITTEVGLKLEVEREQFLDIAGRANTSGKAGLIAGGFAGVLTDPLVMATLPFGAARSHTILRAMAVESAIAAAIEVPIQAQVMEFKKDIGSPYGLKDAAVAVGTAGVGAGAFTGLFRGIPAGGKALVNYLKKEQAEGRARPFTPEEQEAIDLIDAIEEEAAATPFPRTPADDKIYTENLQQGIDELVNDAPRVIDDKDVGSSIDVDGENIKWSGKFSSDLQVAVSRAGEPTININTPERLNLRESIELDLYGKGAPKKQRRVDFVLGKPASGKTTAVAAPLAKKRGAIIIDPDDAKEKLPEFDNGKGSLQVHSESTEISENLTARAVENGDNIVMSVTGKTLNSLERRIKLFVDEGYSVRLHHVDLPTSEAIRRSINRHSEIGRVVHPDLIKQTGDNPKINFETLRKKGELDGFTEWDNQVEFGTPARLISSTERRALVGIGRTRHQINGTRVRQDAQTSSEQTKNYLTDEQRMANARAAVEEFEQGLSTKDELVDAEYNRILSEFSEDTQVPITRTDNTGAVVTDTRSIKNIVADIKLREDALRKVSGCQPGAV